MLHYVHQLVGNIVCPPFGAVQIFKAFHSKQLPAASENNAIKDSGESKSDQ